ncbi:MAG: hypothetical protein IPM18_09970 [Phycisphaerales bacterium]|nr:hypothetical protein [Phycisphaerales bacterium]
MRTWFTRSKSWLVYMSGGSVLALEACDPAVRETVLGGVGSAATSLAGSFIQAFIQSLVTEPEVPTTVQVILDQFQMIVA